MQDATDERIRNIWCRLFRAEPRNRATAQPRNSAGSSLTQSPPDFPLIGRARHFRLHQISAGQAVRAGFGRRPSCGGQRTARPARLPNLRPDAPDLRRGFPKLRRSAPSLQHPIPDFRRCVPKLRPAAISLRRGAPETNPFTPELWILPPDVSEHIKYQQLARLTINYQSSTIN